MFNTVYQSVVINCLKGRGDPVTPGLQVYELKLRLMSLTIFNEAVSVLWVSQKQDASPKYWLCLKIQVDFLKFGE